MKFNKLILLPENRRIGQIIGRFALTGAASFGIGVLSIHERYNNYWTKTIFRVQTVDFNILSHSLPTKLSYALIRNQPQEIQRTLNSNYNLFGLVVTDSSGQKIMASSYQKDKPLPEVNLQQLQKQPYDLLLDPPPLLPQGTYSDPHATERTATNLINPGRVIGRVYYIRGESPSFSADFTKWLSNPLSKSTRADIYTIAMLACLGSGTGFWALWEYLLYKKRVQQIEAQREEERLKQEKKALEIQLIEQVSQVELMQEQWEQQSLNSTNQAEELRYRNQQLEAEVQQLQDAIARLPTSASSLTQTELLKIQIEADKAKHKQQQQEIQLKELTVQLQNYQNRLLEVDKQEIEFQEVELKIEEIQQARHEAELQIKELSQAEQSSQQTIQNLQDKLAQEEQVKNQLNQQLEMLRLSLLESQQQEQKSRLLAERADQQIQILSEEKERLKEDLGQHPLNKFEKDILKCLESSSSSFTVKTQFDAGTGASNSKFIDFLVVTNHCLIAIEAKSYKGAINSIGDSRNTRWTCQSGGNQVLINACWGINPYHQIKTYVDSLMFKFNSDHKNRRSKIPIYGIVVFPKQSRVDENIISNIGGYYRITTLAG